MGIFLTDIDLMSYRFCNSWEKNYINQCRVCELGDNFVGLCEYARYFCVNDRLSLGWREL